MHQQRKAPVPTSEGTEARPWVPPRMQPLSDVVHTDEHAKYVVVDDLDDDQAVLVVAPWPEQDAYGRLTFGDPRQRRTTSVSATDLHDRVAAARRESRQDAVDRPLRIGDTFFAVVTDDTGAVDSFQQLRDVTREAREQAKLAHFAAVAPRVDEAYAQSIGMVDAEDADDGPVPEGPGPSASPAV